MSLLDSKKDMLLVYLDMPYITDAKPYDLMLTPQFYIHKNEKLPVKYAHSATKLAPAILDDLTDDKTYNYAAAKDGDEWMLFAYDMEKIESFLQSKGLNKLHINNIYFVQQVHEKFDPAVSLDEKSSLVDANSTVVMLPKSMIVTDNFANFNESFRPNKSFSFDHSHNSFLSKTQSISLSVLILIISIVYILEGMRYQNEISALDTKVSDAKEKYPSLKNRSNLVLENLYNTNYKIDSTQRRIRERLKDIGQLTSKDSKINSLKIDTKAYEIDISANKKDLKKLKEYAKVKKFKIISKKNTLLLKGEL